MVVTVIGSVSTDFVVTAAKRPLVGETIIGQDFKTTFGGKGANQAVAAARLGAQVEMVAKIGSDLFGSEIRDNLIANHISVANVEPVTHLPSGSAHITLAEGDNSIIVIPGANDAVDLQQVAGIHELLKRSSIVVLQQEIPSETVKEVIGFCFQEGVPTILNPAPARELDFETIEKVTYLTPNEHEFQALFPDWSVSEGLKKFPNKLMITVGSKGVLVHDGRKELLIPAYPVSPVDTTGAGDTFNGAFAVAITKGLAIEESIRFGNLAAALSIQKFGAQGGMPTLKEMKEHPDYEEKWNFK